MRKVTINLYAFDELSEKAKIKALQELYSAAEYHWHSENTATLEAIEKAFKLERFEWGYDVCTSHYRFTLPHDFKQGMNKERLKLILKYMKKDNPLVNGYWLLDDFENKFLACFDEKGDIKSALDHAINTLVKNCQCDMESYFSDKSLAEHAMDSEYEFIEDGSLA